MHRKFVDNNYEKECKQNQTSIIFLYTKTEQNVSKFPPSSQSYGCRLFERSLIYYHPKGHKLT